MSLKKAKKSIDITKIINHLDEHLKKTGRSNIDAVEANRILAIADLLEDNTDRRGKPLRDLLRKGLLPHAYQTGGKGSNWVIPKSSVANTVGSNYEQKPKSTAIKGKSNAEDTKPENIDEILKEIEKARLKYKPDVVKYLLIAEAPPDNIDRFFYFENVKQHDYLFLGVAQAVYPKLKGKFLTERRSEETKKEILEKLQVEGFYLIDLSDLPLSLLEGDLIDQLPNLIEKIKEVAVEDTRIILIKANVYDLVYPYLVSQGIKNVIDKRITFPGQGGQKKFQVEFVEALKDVGYK